MKRLLPAIALIIMSATAYAADVPGRQALKNGGLKLPPAANPAPVTTRQNITLSGADALQNVRCDNVQLEKNYKATSPSDPLFSGTLELNPFAKNSYHLKVTTASSQFKWYFGIYPEVYLVQKNDACKFWLYNKMDDIAEVMTLVADSTTGRLFLSLDTSAQAADKRILVELLK